MISKSKPTGPSSLCATKVVENDLSRTAGAKTTIADQDVLSASLVADYNRKFSAMAGASQTEIIQTPHATVALWKNSDNETVYAIGQKAAMLAPKKASNQVFLRNFTFDPVDIDTKASRFPSLLAGDANPLQIVQFKTQFVDDYRAILQQLGAEVLNYLPDNAFVIRVNPADLQKVKNLSFVRAVTPMQPAYKLAENFLEALSQGGSGQGLLGTLPRQVQMQATSAADVEKLSAEIVAAGGRVVLAEAGTPVVTADLTPSAIEKLSQSANLLWIEDTSEIGVDIDNARIVGGANALESVADLSGKGLAVHIFEGIDAKHPAFKGNEFRKDPIAIADGRSDSHGTATAGEIAASGRDNPKGKGIVPNVQVIYTHNSAVVNQTDPKSRMEITREAQKLGAVAQTASWGHSLTSKYNVYSLLMDTIAHQLDMFITNSQSNAGSTQSRPEAWAKNVSPGLALYHFDNTDPSDDKWGRGGSIRTPERPGRSMAGWYDQIFTTAPGGGYRTDFGGTSGGTPITNGYSIQVIEMFVRGLFGNTVDPSKSAVENRPHNATVAALMMVSGRQWEFDGAGHDRGRTHQGWGFPDTKRLYDKRDQVFIINGNDPVKNLETKTYEIEVGDGEPELKIAMTYSDPPGTVAAANPIVNDLDLKVTAPDGTVYLGNHGLLEGMYSKTGGQAFKTDNVENVFVKAPQAGKWKIEVIGSAVNQDGYAKTQDNDQHFALVALGVKKKTA